MGIYSFITMDIIKWKRPITPIFHHKVPVYVGFLLSIILLKIDIFSPNRKQDLWTFL